MPGIESNLPPGYVTPITPTEFEKLVCNYLKESGQGLPELTVQHNVQSDVDDGDYQIDVRAEFEAFGGSKFITLVECKLYKSKVKREKVEILNSRLKSIGANKGMIFSTSGFQKGALTYAERHKIALVWVIEGKFTYMTKSQEKEEIEIPDWVSLPKFVGLYTYFTDEGLECTYSLQPGCMDGLSDFFSHQ
ncbi:hypothetical protein GCM10027299_28800 [Larkinella ripae]